MVGCVAVSYDGFDMFFCRISHVPFPSVLRVFLREPAHVLVPVCLGEDRGGGDGCEFCVSLDYALVLIAVEGLESVAVDEQILGFHSQSAHRPLHSGDGGVEYVDCVDFFCADFLDGPCERFPLDDRAEGFAGFLGHFLGVVEQRVTEVLGEDYGGGEDRTGQGTSSGFVTARFNQVFVEIAQKMWFIAHSAKIRNLFVLVKGFFEHCDDFVLGTDCFVEAFHKLFEIGYPAFHYGHLASVFSLHVFNLSAF